MDHSFHGLFFFSTETHIHKADECFASIPTDDDDWKEIENIAFSKNVLSIFVYFKIQKKAIGTTFIPQITDHVNDCSFQFSLQFYFAPIPRINASAGSDSFNL